MAQGVLVRLSWTTIVLGLLVCCGIH